jgi:hypothetical protein
MRSPPPRGRGGGRSRCAPRQERRRPRRSPRSGARPYAMSVDWNPCAQLRSPMDMMRHRWLADCHVQRLGRPVPAVASWPLVTHTSCRYRLVESEGILAGWKPTPAGGRCAAGRKPTWM